MHSQRCRYSASEAAEAAESVRIRIYRSDLAGPIPVSRGRRRDSAHEKSVSFWVKRLRRIEPRHACVRSIGGGSGLITPPSRVDSRTSLTPNGAGARSLAKTLCDLERAMCAGRRHRVLFKEGAEPQPPPSSLSKHHLGRDKGHRRDGNFRGQAESLVVGGSYGDTAPRDGGSIYARVGERNRPIYLKREWPPREMPATAATPACRYEGRPPPSSSPKP
jgi:hypothetical protein